MATEKPTRKRYKLAEGDKLSIPGCPVKITSANLNSDNMIAIIRRMEATTGRTYFGTSIVEA